MKTRHVKFIGFWPLRYGLLLILLVVALLALSPAAWADCREGCDNSNFNTFLGDNALSSNTAGLYNTAVGTNALKNNTAGSQNTAIGLSALTINTTGFANTATGYSALQKNTSGGGNTATGFNALLSNTFGGHNTANGEHALFSNTSGFDNVANGGDALKVSNGSNNTADGYQALFGNTTGSNNIAIGSSAGANLTTGSNNIDIGAFGAAGEANTMRLGESGTQTNTYIAGISGVTVAGGVDVIIDGSGHLGTMVSSARYKENIQPMDKASEAILSLKPVTFRYKHDLDPEGIPQFGLVAEQVEKVNPDLVACDQQGKPYTVRYEAVNAMLLNEFLKEHRKVEQLEKQVEALTAGLQKVSAQPELSKPAPQVVNNP
jgi:hypothetical protein